MLPMNAKISEFDRFVFPERELVTKYDTRTVYRPIVDFALSVLRQIHYLCCLGYYSLTLNTPSDENLIWKESSKGLVVLIHGLHNRPAHFFKQIELLRKEKDLDVYAPNVVKRGACTLDEAVEPIFKKVIEYIHKHPGKPICLLGISNGARITTEMETKLRCQARFTPVKVSNISGAHFGSSFLSLGNWLKLSPLVVNRAVRDELSYGSDRAKELITEAQKPLPWLRGARKYEYFASTEDFVISDLNSSLPKLQKKAKFHVLHGHSHNSIVAAVAKKQVASCVKWMGKNQPSKVAQFFGRIQHPLGKVV